MRVGLVIYGSLATVSGGYLYDRQLVDYLRAQGDHVEIISLPWRDYPRHLADNLSPRLAGRLCRAAVDILLQDELNHPSLWWLNGRLRARLPYPVVSIVHHLRCCEQHPRWLNRLYTWIERRYLASVDGFVFNSQTTRAAVERLVGGTRPAVVAYPGGDRLRPAIGRAEIAARIERPGPLSLIFIGNLIPRKGLHTLLAALARLRHRDWELTVVGNAEVDPPYTRRLRRQIAQARLSDRVRLAGQLSDAELAAHLRASHLLVLPSTYEGFGIVYVEAMGYGVPVVATTAGAAREIITPGQQGLLVAPDDPDGLADALATLAADRTRLLAMSLVARERALTHPTWQATAARIRAFLVTMRVA